MQTVAVLYGGPSLEHDISIASGIQVLEHLDRSRFRALPVLIGRDGSWEVGGEQRGAALEGALALRAAGCDIAFLALHGPFGEDGTIQGFLETLALPYTGSGPQASAWARHKTRAKRYLATLGIAGAPDLTLPPATAEQVRERLGFPVVVKDPTQGSTLGLELAVDRAAFDAAVGRLGAQCDELLVERREIGREFTVPILEDARGNPEVLPLVEIRAPNGFFDYAAKYTAGGAEEVVDPEVDPAPAATMRDWARRAHTALGLRGFSRADFILRPDGSVVFLETNSIPGLTATSLLPQSAAAAGIDFAALLTRLIDNGLARG